MLVLRIENKAMTLSFLPENLGLIPRVKLPENRSNSQRRGRDKIPSALVKIYLLRQAGMGHLEFVSRLFVFVGEGTGGGTSSELVSVTPKPQNPKSPEEL